MYPNSVYFGPNVPKKECRVVSLRDQGVQGLGARERVLKGTIKA